MIHTAAPRGPRAGLESPAPGINHIRPKIRVRSQRMVQSPARWKKTLLRLPYYRGRRIEGSAQAGVSSSKVRASQFSLAVAMFLHISSEVEMSRGCRLGSGGVPDVAGPGSEAFAQTPSESTTAARRATSRAISLLIPKSAPRIFEAADGLPGAPFSRATSVR